MPPSKRKRWPPIKDAPVLLAAMRYIYDHEIDLNHSRDRSHTIGKTTARTLGLADHFGNRWFLTKAGVAWLGERECAAALFSSLNDPHGLLIGLDPSIFVKFYRYSPIGRPNNECWEWFGPVSDRCYGRLNCQKGFVYATHLALLIDGRPLPPDKEPCHTCDNPPCINPTHLFIGSRSDNMKDCYGKGRRQSAFARFIGTKNHKAKLDAGQIRQIRSLRADGKTQKHIADIFDIDPSTVAQIVNGKTWRHVDA